MVVITIHARKETAWQTDPEERRDAERKSKEKRRRGANSRKEKETKRNTQTENKDGETVRMR